MMQVKNKLSFLVFSSLFGVAWVAHANPGTLHPGPSHGGYPGLAFTNPASGAECREFVSKLPQNSTRGVLTVPEDWDHPNGAKTQIFYYTRPAEDHELTGKIPVVFFNGGPAMSSHAGFGAIQATLGFRQLPMVLIDQRGTGCSQKPPEDYSRMIHFGSHSIVRDAELVRKTLFGEDKKWRVFGQSFGGLIAHRYLELAPEGIEAAYSHGYSVMKDPAQLMNLRISAQYRSMETYFHYYPEDRKTLERIRELALREQEITIAGYKIPADLFLDVLHLYSIHLSYFDSYDSVHRDLSEMVLPSGKLNAEPVSKFANHLDSVFNSADLSVLLGALEVFPGLDIRNHNKELLNEYKNRNVDMRQWFNSCILAKAAEDFQSLSQNSASEQAEFEKTISGMLAIARRHLSPISLETISKNLEQNPHLKFFLYSSVVDPLAPPETFEEEVSFLGKNVNYKYLERSGHEGYRTESQIHIDLVSPSVTE